jgi:hypothetical protein
MPSSATITAFVTLVAGTKARAGHMNTNFGTWRGHVLPVDPNTAASAHQLYDLGATDAQWRRIYLKEPPFVNGSQLGKVEIETLWDGSNPADVIEDINYLGICGFPKDTATSVRFHFRVPDDYISGNRISLEVHGYCDTGASQITMETVATLFRGNTITGQDVASLTLPANRLTSTANFFVPTTPALMFKTTSLRLTDASGQINSLTVTAGNILAVDLKRTGAALADTNSGYFNLTNVIVDLNN